MANFLHSFYLICVTAALLLHSTSTTAATANHHVVRLDSLFPPEDACEAASRGSSTNNEGFLQVFHRHGCSPDITGEQSKPASSHHHHQILDRDQIRVDTLFHLSGGGGASIPDSPGSSLGTGNYVVTVALGTPPRNQTVVFDTGSDVTWVQCKPCANSCYQQNDPIFDPTQSSTYSNISCSSPRCSQLDVSGCSGGTCLYGVQYGDSSFTIGFFATDTLAIAGDVLPDFMFGCGENNQGGFGEADGLLGLGRKPTSLVSQSAARYGGEFSYCLPSPASAVAGYLTFGDSPPIGSGAKYTPMLTDTSRPTFYFVSLVGLSVGGVRLSIPPSAFSRAGTGTVVDSGTVITRLPPAAYSALRSAFRRKMAAAKYPPAPAVSILDTCYDLSNYTEVEVPAVALMLGGGVTVELDVSGIVYAVRPSQVCLAFAGNSAATDLPILGNVQQRTFGVRYDVPRRLIGFAAGGCN